MNKKNPVLLVMWTTDRCNLKCKYCYAKKESSLGDMSLETALCAIEKWKDHPMKIQFAGGEPLLNEALIFQVIDYCKTKGYQASYQMQTNGTCLTLENARELQKNRVSLGISLDGAPPINEMLRGKTKEVVAGIQVLASLGQKVNINGVVTRENVKELHSLADFCYYLGNVHGIGLDILRIAGRAQKREVHLPGKKELEEGFLQLYERVEFLNGLGRHRLILREVEEAKKRLSGNGTANNYCYASCGLSYVVLPNGQVYPCGTLIGNPSYFMGNIKGPVKEICLPSSKNSLCQSCRYQRICPGGCPSRKIVNEEKENFLDLDCILRKTAFGLAEKE